MNRLLSSTRALIAGLLIGILAGAIYVKVHYDLPNGPTAMKAFLENYGLNLLGDTVAGFLGLATFIVVLFTYFAQKAMAKQTINEMKSQNVLSGKIANANYKLALFDKRLKAYNHFIEARARLTTDDSRDPAIIRVLSNAVREAEFVYDQSLRARLVQITDAATTLGLISMRIEREHKRRDTSPRQWSESDEERLQEDYMEFGVQSAETHDMLYDPDLQETFNNHLTLPDRIVEEEDKTGRKH